MTDESEMSDDLGGWDVSSLDASVHQRDGLRGSDFDVDDQTRFVRGVASLVRKLRARSVACQELAVFLLCPTPPKGQRTTRAPMLDNGRTPIDGHVWFVSAPVLSGHSQPLDSLDDNSVFQFVTQTLCAGAIPAVIVDSRQSPTEVRYYPKGLSMPDSCSLVTYAAGELTPTDVQSVIFSVYKQCLVTPSAQPGAQKLWEDAAKSYVTSDAEGRIQGLLKSAFAARFPTCRIDHELVGVSGRADLHIEEPDPLDSAKVTHLAVLELKVLRSYGERGARYTPVVIQEAIEKGLRQAQHYRDERKHKIAALVCFDMRIADDGETCFACVKAAAAQASVFLWRWYMYSSSELFRKANS